MQSSAPTPKKPVKILHILLMILGACLMFSAGFITAMTLNSNATNTSPRQGGLTVEDVDGMSESSFFLKPAIYLYPTEPTEVVVTLNFDGEITTDIPKYDNTISGWKVFAQPSGLLIAADGLHYPYLFWEGKPNHLDRYNNPDQGFIVPAADAEDFLRNSLPQLGLIESEYEEFIDFWLPKLERNSYNLIHFAGQDYQAEAQLTVQPKPDSMIRVFMVVQPLDQPVQIPEQSITTPVRTGFTVVEWGGTILH